MSLSRCRPITCALGLLTGLTFTLTTEANNVCDPDVTRRRLNAQEQSEAYLNCKIDDLISAFTESSGAVVKSGHLLQDTLHRSLTSDDDEHTASTLPAEFETALVTASTQIELGADLEPDYAQRKDETLRWIDTVRDSLISINNKIKKLGEENLTEQDKRLTCLSRFSLRKAKRLRKRISECITTATAQTANE